MNKRADDPNDSSDPLFFQQEAEKIEDNNKGPNWKVIVSDDDEQVHHMTRLVLERFSFQNREIEIFSAYSGQETKILLEKHPDCAAILLDVVMEEDETGFDIVRYIRDSLNNDIIQILIRTGQPSLFSEARIFEDYDINAYKDKTELTSQRLRLSIMSLLRSFERAQSLSMVNKQLQGSLHEKEVLLQEVHHRVKNNMQIVSSLINLQSVYIKNESDRMIFLQSERRVRSMAMVHEKLYQSKKLSSINFGEYIRELVPELLNAFGWDRRNVNIVIDAMDVSLSIDEAVPSALLLNELVTNALKYAFPEDISGEVRIDYYASDGLRVLSVSDTGVGLPESFSLGATDSLGLNLVKALSDQLKGSLEFIEGPGTSIKVSY